MLTAKHEEIYSTMEKPDSLNFKFLPSYAGFILRNLLEEFAYSTLVISREVKLPLLRYFKDFSEAELKKLSVNGIRELLLHMSQNNITEYIQSSAKSWKENQLPLLQSDNIIAEDITSISFVRRKAFRDFIPRYSTNVDTIIQVMEEVDKFTVAIEESSYKILVDLHQQKILEHNFLIDKLNNTAPGFIYIFDLSEQKEIFSDHKIGEMLGYSQQDLKKMGQNILLKLIHPDDISEILKYRQNFILGADGEMRTMEYRILDKTGLYNWHREYNTVFKRNEDGAVTQIIGVSIDITAEKEAVSRLKLNEQLLREAQEIAEMGSFVWDFEGPDSLYSPQLLKIFGLEEKAEMATFLEYVHPSDRKKVETAVQKAMQGDGIYECEYRYRKGEEEKVIWSKGIVSFRDKKAIKMRGTVMNVTQRHIMLRRLERSEELHKQAQALTHLGNWNWNILDNTIYWSDEMYRIYGLEPQSENITFDRFLSFVHPDDRQKRLDEINKALESRHADDYIVKIIAADGNFKVLSGKGQVLVDESNKVYKLTGTCQDITNEYLLNEQLKDSEATFRQLIFNAPDSVIVIDAEGLILLWNPIAEKMFGWTEVEVLGRPLEQTFIPPSYRHHPLNGLNRLKSGGETHILNKTVEVTALRKNGDEFYVALSIARSYRSGKPAYISFIRDISREKRAEMDLQENRNQLTQKNIELERSNQELLSFNYIASHDLQEPIRKIKIFSSKIIDKGNGGLPEGIADTVRQITASADYMQRLIDALLSYSRITSEDGGLQSVDLNKVLEEVKSALRDSIDERKAEITASTLPILMAIPVQIFQLLENLLTNSLKYSNANRIPRIRIKSRTVSGEKLAFEGVVRNIDYYEISVKDNGIGFDQQYAEKIFELFQRLHAKNEYSGTGVGLAICKKIVQNHNGFISATSSPGQGSIVNVYFPCDD
jgi:PAS domain S-box-containing protein